MTVFKTVAIDDLAGPSGPPVLNALKVAYGVNQFAGAGADVTESVPGFTAPIVLLTYVGATVAPGRLSEVSYVPSTGVLTIHSDSATDASAFAWIMFE